MSGPGSMVGTCIDPELDSFMNMNMNLKTSSKPIFLMGQNMREFGTEHVF